MSDERPRLNSDFFKVFDIDARQAARGIVTGDRERDELRVAALLATINAANTLADISTVVNRVVDMAILLTSADRGILLLKDGEGGFTVEVARNCFGKALPDDTAYSQSIPKQVLESGESYWIVDTLSDDKTVRAKSVADLQLRTIMCAPLRIRDEITGVMYLDSKLANREFRNADLTVFEAICLQLAVTLENAWINHAAVQTERAVTIAHMTSVLMDKLVQPLVEVEAHALSLEEEEELPESVRDRGKRIRELASQSLELLDTIQEYAGGEGGYVREEVTLSSLVQSALERYRTEIEAQSIEVSFGLDSEGRVSMDPERMGRVISSLVRNAIVAMPDGGNLTLRIGEVEEGWVELSISDSGTALGEDALETAYEPFMSPGKRVGAGLDLAVVRQVVENHGGSIAVVSPEGEDTRFLIRLPLPPRRTDTPAE